MRAVQVAGLGLPPHRLPWRHGLSAPWGSSFARLLSEIIPPPSILSVMYVACGSTSRHLKTFLLGCAPNPLPSWSHTLNAR